MPQSAISVSGTINAEPQRVYMILADYHRHHPHILPREYFRHIEVERGGVGNGTIVRFTMKVMGITRSFRHEISEPEPGRILVEADPEKINVTTFTVDPGADGRTSLTIETRYPTRTGLVGAFERRTTAFMLKQIYRKELALLDTYAQSLRAA